MPIDAKIIAGMASKIPTMGTSHRACFPKSYGHIEDKIFALFPSLRRTSDNKHFLLP